MDLFLVVEFAWRTGLGGNDFNVIRQALLVEDDPDDTHIGRSLIDVAFHDRRQSPTGLTPSSVRCL
jgi:hypothetical protein